ncbi:MAG: hypothetical protein M3N51_04305 [Actinomycetota bacterium]|nr:hypothetical protein [Actinomycetota bacterium]
MLQAIGWLVVAAMALMACGGQADGGGDSAAMGPGLSIEEALASELEGPLLVSGALVAVDDEVRLCTALAESFPPQCGGPSLIVQGLDLSQVPDLSSEGSVTWSEGPVQLLGRVQDEVLIVESRSQA